MLSPLGLSLRLLALVRGYGIFTLLLLLFGLTRSGIVG
jgi:hypothetical protein